MVTTTEGETEYVPFGPEWEAEMMKWKKADIISVFRNSLKESRERADWFAEEQERADSLHKERATLTEQNAKLTVQIDEVQAVATQRKENNQKLREAAGRLIERLEGPRNQQGLFQSIENLKYLLKEKQK